MEKPTVLIVDDEKINLNLLANLLQDDYRVLVAKNGEQCLRRARGQQPPDLVLLDILMPDMDGYEVCRQLKADAKTRNIPLVFVSVKQSEEDRRHGLAQGAAAYIAKPFEPAEVRACVAELLNLGTA